MINRELTEREKEILGMIRPTTFRDIVDAVRRDVEHSKYDAKRELRNLRNGVTNGDIHETTNGDIHETTKGIHGTTKGDIHETTKGDTDEMDDVVGGTHGRERINHICRDICEVSI